MWWSNPWIYLPPLVVEPLGQSSPPLLYRFSNMISLSPPSTWYIQHSMGEHLAVTYIWINNEPGIVVVVVVVFLALCLLCSPEGHIMGLHCLVPYRVNLIVRIWGVGRYNLGVLKVEPQVAIIIVLLFYSLPCSYLYSPEMILWVSTTQTPHHIDYGIRMRGESGWHNGEISLVFCSSSLCWVIVGCTWTFFASRPSITNLFHPTPY